ncbi:hypothetical protein J7E80_23240 [Arthrobacter sp. ISL-28]|nr:hypothetical protein [Arthrobacter sp. ISL-28]
MERSGQVEAVIVGQVFQAGAGRAPARQASFGAGIGWDVPAITISKLCLSGRTAVMDAARMIRAHQSLTSCTRVRPSEDPEAVTVP